MRAILKTFRANTRLPPLQALKTAIAIALGWVVSAALLQVEMPIFSAIATVIVVAPSVNQSFSKAIERTIGVLIGVVLAAAMSSVFPVVGPMVLATTAVAIVLAWALRVTPGALNQMVISSMLVLVLGGTTPFYALDRILETIIGAASGFLVNALIVPPTLTEPAREQLRLLGAEVAAAFERLAVALLTPQHPVMLQTLMIEARLLRPMRDQADAKIVAGIESLQMNPRARRHRDELQGMRALLDDRLTPIVTQVIGMTRAFVDQYDDTMADEDTTPALAEQFRRAAHDVRLAVHLADIDPEPMTSAVPALTGPLSLRPPNSEHWILFGSLMEDLRRIREELLGNGEEGGGAPA